MVKLFHTWQCNEQENFSDHMYITFCIEKHKIIFHDFNYNGVKYITSEMGFQNFENNFIKENKNNFMIRETLDLDNTLRNTDFRIEYRKCGEEISRLYSSSKQEIV